MSAIRKEPYTKAELTDQLAAMAAPRDGVILIHSALRLIGPMEEGARTLLDALIEYVSADGGLICVPTHTWRNLKQEITLDLNHPHTCLGAFSDFAAADPRGVRSEHPTHSMAVFGNRERAEAFIGGEIDVRSATDPVSCYGKLYREGGKILLAGVSHNRNTYLHCVEEMIGTPNRLSAEPRTVRVKRRSGEIVERCIRTHHTDFTNDVSLRFPKYETAFRYHGAVTDGFLGNAPTQLCDARIMKDVMELIATRAAGTDPLATEKDIPPLWFC